MKIFAMFLKGTQIYLKISGRGVFFVLFCITGILSLILLPDKTLFSIQAERVPMPIQF